MTILLDGATYPLEIDASKHSLNWKGLQALTLVGPPRDNPEPDLRHTRTTPQQPTMYYEGEWLTMQYIVLVAIIKKDCTHHPLTGGGAKEKVNWVPLGVCDSVTLSLCNSETN